MLSIKKSTRRPFSWCIARKLTISASARAAAGAGGAAIAGSACGFDQGGFWPSSSRPIRTTTDSAKAASDRYDRKGSVAGATAAPFTARISRTPRIKAILIADTYLCLLCGAAQYVIGDYNRCANQGFWSRPAALDPSSPFLPSHLERLFMPQSEPLPLSSEVSLLQATAPYDSGRPDPRLRDARHAPAAETRATSPNGNTPRIIGSKGRVSRHRPRRRRVRLRMKLVSF